MERSLLWSALALGCVGWLCGMALTRARQGTSEEETGLAHPYLFTALALPVLVFLATLPSRPPFAAGQGWGRGFLLGGAGVLLAAWVVLRAPRRQNSPLHAAALVTAPCCAALVAVAVPLLWMRETIIDALLGIAIGWFVGSFTLFLGLTGARGQEEADHPFTLIAGLAFTVTLCATAALGIYRGGGEFQAARWSAVAMAFAAGVPLALLVSALPSSFFARIALKLPLAGLLARFFTGDQIRDLMSRGWRLLLCAALLLGLGKLLSVKVIEQPSLFPLVALGLAVGLLAWWLASEGVQGFRRSGVAENPEHPNHVLERSEGTPMPEHLPPLAAMVVLSGFMVAFTLLAGFGVGILLLAAWPVVGLALIHAMEGKSTGQRVNESMKSMDSLTYLPTALTRLLLFGVILLLYRLFTTRFATEIKGVGLTDHFALFGFLFGALLPAFLAGLLLRAPSGASLSPTVGVLRLVLTGAITLTAPALLLFLWGPKCALALLAGLALSGALTLNTRAPERLNASLFALAVALALAQWTSHILPLASMTRAEKIRIVLWAIGALIVLIAAADYGGRFGEWLRRRRSNLTPGPSPVQGEGSR